MVKFIEREFSRNPITKGKITSSIGYIYGECARKLWYICNTNREGFTQNDIDAMNYGTSKHKEIQENKFPNMLHEYHTFKEIPEIYGINEIGCTVDCYQPIKVLDEKDNDKIIEIKPKYERKAYYQTLIQRFVFPYTPIFLYDYIKERLFPLKADYKMAVIYVGRIITATKVKPPRVPYAIYSKAPCNKCIFRERCYSETDEPRPPVEMLGENKEYWNRWKKFTEKPIKILQDNC